MNDTPNAASVALLHRGKVLLIQRAYAPWSGAWSLPGGRREDGETAEACAERELREELGLAVYALRPVLRMRLGGSGNFVLQVFGTESFEGEITPNHEISGYRWVLPEHLHLQPTTPHLGDAVERAFRLFDRS